MTEPLRRNTPLRRTGGLKRTPMPQKRAKERRTLPGGEVEAARQRRQERKSKVEFSERTKRRAANAWGHRCAMCLRPIDEYHHRKMRSARGLGWFENCLPLCSVHHGIVHHNTGWAYRHGLLVQQHDDPRRIEPVVGCEISCEIDHRDQ